MNSNSTSVRIVHSLHFAIPLTEMDDPGHILANAVAVSLRHINSRSTGDGIHFAMLAMRASIGECMMDTIHVVDARTLEPPEPMERVMDALSSMKPGEKVKLLLYREPYPLYGILKRNHYVHQATLRDDGTFEILIWEGIGWKD
jgi:tRNA 2-thiouridine synthesizing protein A